MTVTVTVYDQCRLPTVAVRRDLNRNRDRRLVTTVTEPRRPSLGDICVPGSGHSRGQSRSRCRRDSDSDSCQPQSVSAPRAESGSPGQCQCVSRRVSHNESAVSNGLGPSSQPRSGYCVDTWWCYVGAAAPAARSGPSTSLAFKLLSGPGCRL